MALTPVNGDLAGHDRDLVLRYLNLDPKRVEVQALIEVARRYGLDPLLNHVNLIPAKDGGPARPYITRDGLLHIAHRSGVFDGIDIEAVTADDDCWRTWATVYRTDRTRPFRYPGRYPKTMPGESDKRAAARLVHGEEMAIKAAELHALRRAFDVLEDIDPVPRAWTAAQAERIAELTAGLTDDQRTAASAWKERQGLDWRNPTAAQADAAIGYLEELTAPERAGAGPT